jgi:hypothetical protein
MTSKINKVRISLRLPPALHKRLKDRAQLEHRSLHSQIVWLLESTAAARAAVGASGDRAGPTAG